jgi:hypothetical protein
MKSSLGKKNDVVYVDNDIFKVIKYFGYMILKYI